jgi:hypothetical protein
MSCFRFVLKDISRYQHQYPLVRSDDNLYLFGSGPFEAGYVDVPLEMASQASFVFRRPFSGVPNVVAGFRVLNGGAPNINVYVESVTETGGVVRTSAPVTGVVVVHAIYDFPYVAPPSPPPPPPSPSPPPPSVPPPPAPPVILSPPTITVLP